MLLPGFAIGVERRFSFNKLLRSARQTAVVGIQLSLGFGRSSIVVIHELSAMAAAASGRAAAAACALLLFVLLVLGAANAAVDDASQEEEMSPWSPAAPAPSPASSIDCGSACAARCAVSSRWKLCRRACGSCCARCNCVPPGTAGHLDVCPCYAAITTRGGRRKCP